MNVVDSARKELKENGGILFPSKKRGPTVKQLEEQCPNLEKFLIGLVEEVKTGGYLTIGIMREKINAKYNALVSRKRIRKALRRLGFRYCTRREVWISKRDTPAVQTHLWEFAEFVNRNNVKNAATGRYEYKDGISFVDESHLFSEDQRKKSWFDGSNKFMEVCTKGKGVRINIIDGFISNKFLPETRVAWNSRCTTGEYKGHNGTTF